jgi:glycosyltransferase involved in cell wall biosynthesis
LCGYEPPRRLDFRAQKKKAYFVNVLKYYTSFLKNCFRSSRRILPGFSVVVVTYNRSRFLEKCIDAIIAATEMPFELIIWDNNSTDNTQDVVKGFIAAKAPLINLKSRRNIGTNGYAAAFLTAKHQYLVEVDDDILAVPKGWDLLMDRAFKMIPRLGYCALDVIQDCYTNGAKPEVHQYRDIDYKGIHLLEGPTGGWFSATTRQIYNRVGGFIYLPSKSFRAEDGNYSWKMNIAGYRYGLLKEVYAYHACGEKWNAAFGYDKVWKEKYSKDHPSLVDLIDAVPPESLPDMAVPEKALHDILCT